MDLISQVALLFGVIFQLFLLLKKHFFNFNEHLKWFLVIIISLIIIFLLQGISFDYFIATFALSLAFISVFAFREKIIPLLNEGFFIFLNLFFIFYLITNNNPVYSIVTLFFSILMFFMYFSMSRFEKNRYSGSLIFFIGTLFSFGFIIVGFLFIAILENIQLEIFNTGIIFLSLLIPIFFILVSVKKKVHSIIFQGVSYFWYIVLLLILEFFVLYDVFLKFFSGIILPVEIYFLIGASSTYSLMLVTNILQSIPVQGENQTTYQAMRDVYESMNLFAEKFSDSQLLYKDFFKILILALISFIPIILGFITLQYYILLVIPFSTLVLRAIKIHN